MLPNKRLSLPTFLSLKNVFKKALTCCHNQDRISQISLLLNHTWDSEHHCLKPPKKENAVYCAAVRLPGWSHAFTQRTLSTYSVPVWGHQDVEHRAPG